MSEKKKSGTVEVVKLQCWECGCVFDEDLEEGWQIGRIGNSNDPFNEMRRPGLMKGRHDGSGHEVTDLVCRNCGDSRNIQRFENEKKLSEHRVTLNRVLRRFQDKMSGKRPSGKSMLDILGERVGGVMKFDTSCPVVFDVIPGPKGDPMPLTMPYIDYADDTVMRQFNKGAHYHERYDLQHAPWDVSYCFIDAFRTLEELLGAIYWRYSEKILSFILRKPPEQIREKVKQIQQRRHMLRPALLSVISELKALVSDDKRSFGDFVDRMRRIGEIVHDWCFRPSGGVSPEDGD